MEKEDENKEEDKQEKENKKSKKSVSKESRTLMWAAIVLLIVFFSSYYAFKSFNTFEYRGLQFTKQKIGDIPYFQTYYYFQDSSGRPVNYLLNLRIDPRKNNVSLIGEIKLPKQKIIYLSANETGFEDCQPGEKAAAVSSFVLFLKGSGIDVKAASPDKDISAAKSIIYANCENRPQNSVILIKNSGETKINSTGTCFIVEISNCQFLSAFEKFEVETLAQAKERGSF